MPAPTRSPLSAKRHLLLGILARQMDFISPEAWTTALNAWIGEPARSLGQILVAQGALSSERRGVLEALVEEHLQAHGADPARSLASLRSLGWFRAPLQHIQDPDLQARLASVVADLQPDDDPYATRAPESEAAAAAECPKASPPVTASAHFEALLALGQPACPEASPPVTASALADSHATRDGPELAAVPAAVVPANHETIAGYDLLGELGRGGMGVVYKARQVKLNRLVALKMILAGAYAGPEQRQRFQGEAEAIARLSHPNIVQIHEVGEVAGKPYFSLELVEGGSLASRLDGTPLPAPPAARLIETLARAMHAAHQVGIVHRDLKPGNVLLGGSKQTPLGECTPKISDFGLARRLDHSGQRTESGVIIGTPSYMAPEQAQGQSKQSGPPADVYALGAILYELLTGRPPFKAETLMDTLQQVIAVDPVSPRRLQPKIPPDLETICLKCLQKEPSKRYATALALAEDLQRYREGVPILARPTPAWEVAWKWIQRRPATAALILLGIGTLVSLVAVILWSNAQLQTAVTEARLAEKQAQAEKQEALERDRVSATRVQSQQLLLAAQTALAQSDRQKAQMLASQARTRVAEEPSLADIKAGAEQVLAQSQRWESAQAKYRQFFQRRHDALFYLTPFTGQGVPANLKATQDLVREALALFDLAVDAETPLVLDAAFTEAEQAEIRAGCYELLLVLAEAVARPLPQQKDGDRQVQLQQALRILDRAHQLGARGPAWHRRRADYLHQLGNPAAAEQERRRVQDAQPIGVIDYFLEGEQAYHRGQLPEAIQAFENVVRREPNHFWALFFLGTCQLKPNPVEARVYLSAAIRQRPDFLWSYVARGIAHGELAALADQQRDLHQK